MAVRDTKMRTWKVEGVVPGEMNGRPWNKNLNLEVFAFTLEEAVRGVREKYPDIALHKVMGDRWAQDVIVVGQQTNGGDQGEV